MPKLNVLNLEQIRARDPLLGELVDSIVKGVNNIVTQTGTDPTQEEALPPPQISSLKVSSGGGGFHVQILDNNPVSRQIHYFVEYSTTPGFQAPYVQDLGPSRNAYLALGNKTLHFRAYSAYATGPASSPIYHGGANPIPVQGGGAVSGAPLLPSSGSGTADINGTQGATGFGPTQVRKRVE